jgi:flap endonuclease-1
MGVNLTPIIQKRIVTLKYCGARSFAVDANNYLYQFLALIRTPEGHSLSDSQGNITSHLTGLIFRTTNLMSYYKMHLIFVFDGAPSKLKANEIERRRRIRKKANKEWKEALKTGNYAKAFSKSVYTSKLTRSMIEDAKHLLDLLGIPNIQAPSDAEAQAAFMARRGDVWAVSSKDYDSLLFGAPRLLRFLTLTGKEYLPSKGIYRSLHPELIVLQRFLEKTEISRKQLVDAAILIGTDFNIGVKGIGPKKALKLIRTHGQLEDLPSEIHAQLPANVNEVRRTFLTPDVTKTYEAGYKTLREAEVYKFLCGERNFSESRVQTAVKRMKTFYSWMKQSRMERWLKD